MARALDSWSETVLHLKCLLKHPELDARDRQAAIDALKELMAAMSAASRSCKHLSGTWSRAQLVMRDAEPAPF